MREEILEKITDSIMKTIENEDISTYEKVELMLNLKQFLKDYNQNIRILRRGQYEINKRDV